MIKFKATHDLCQTCHLILCSPAAFLLLRGLLLYRLSIARSLLSGEEQVEHFLLAHRSRRILLQTRVVEALQRALLPLACSVTCEWAVGVLLVLGASYVPTCDS